MERKKNEENFVEILNEMLQKCEIEQIEISRKDIVAFLNDSGKFNERFYEDQLFMHTYLNYYNNLSIYKKQSVDKYFLNNFYNKPLSKDTSLIVEPVTNTFTVVKEIDQVLSKLEDNIDLEYEQVVRGDFKKVKSAFEKIEIPKESWLSLTGASNVKKLTNSAAEVYTEYKKIIDGYEDTKYNVLQVIEEYTQLRQQLNFEREDLINILKDSYGSAIYQSFPQLYDFNKIQWLDIDNMFYDLDTQFESIQGKYDAFITLADENLENIKSQVSTSYKSVVKTLNKRRLKSDDLANKLTDGIMSVAISAINNVVSTRLASQEKCLEIKKDIEFMKLSFAPDYQKVIIDLGRLFEIYTNVKKIFIPLVKRYAVYFNSLLNGELKLLLDNYKSIKNSEDYLSREDKIVIKRNNELSIIEHQKSLAECEKKLDSLNAIMKNEIKPIYDVYQKFKPSKPNVLSSFLSLGMNNTTYAYANEIWQSKFAPINEFYNSCISKISNVNSDIDHYKSQIKSLSNLNQDLNIEIEKYSMLIQKAFNNIGGKNLVNKLSKDNLNTILNISREILEKGLRDNLLDPVDYLSKLSFVKPVEGVNRLENQSTNLNKALDLGHKILDINNNLALIKNDLIQRIASNEVLNNFKDFEKAIFKEKFQSYIDKTEILQIRNKEDINAVLSEFVTNKIVEIFPKLNNDEVLKNLYSNVNIISESLIKQLNYVAEIRKYKALNMSNDEILEKLKLDHRNYIADNLKEDEDDSQRILNLMEQNFLN
ncbi:hypothetical protein ACR784_08045 [Sphingobacterium multivorum]|uniref:hypothetical protein n=1 Tax=Sphingobacterium multivorum TaxID=28454 RepID=UPI003DA20A3F